MKIFYALLLLCTTVFSQKEKESPLVSETFKIVNDLNAAEGKPAIYMCREVNGFWRDFLTSPKQEATELDKRNFQKRLDTISKYLGGNLEKWKKGFAPIVLWQAPQIKAKEFVSYRDLDIDAFYAQHKLGVYLYSLPLFDDTRTKALIYVWYMGAHNVTLDNYYYCEKENGVWKNRSIVLIGGFNNR